MRAADEPGPAERIEQLTAERDELHRQSGPLRSELNAARTRLAVLSGPTWRYRAFGPGNEIALDPDINDRWTMTDLGGWRIERLPIYSGPWEPAPAEQLT